MMRAAAVVMLAAICATGCDNDAGQNNPQAQMTTDDSAASTQAAVTTSTQGVASSLPPVLDEQPFDPTDPATVEDLIGQWSDGTNTFTFAADGVLTFTREQSCDGTYALSLHGRLDVDFGDCNSASVLLTAPIFRRATVYREGDSLYLDGDAGVFRLDLVAKG
jgi:hypothetical protein